MSESSSARSPPRVVTHVGLERVGDPVSAKTDFVCGPTICHVTGDTFLPCFPGMRCPIRKEAGLKSVTIYEGKSIECWTVVVNERRYRWAYRIDERPQVDMQGADSRVEVLALKEALFAAMAEIDQELGRRYSKPKGQQQS